MTEGNSTKDYNEFVRVNLPSGMTYNGEVDRYQINNHSFFKFKNANWYYKYITKYGYSAIPESLFANGEVGVWYDPSPETTFTDTAGTTPATVGDAVALMLDKSKGLVLGPELVTNGDFSSATGWNALRVTIADGVADFALNTTGASEILRTDVLPVSGRTYLVELTATAANTGTCFFILGGTFYTVSVVAGLNTYRLVAGSTPTSTGFRANVANAYLGTIDNISVKELPGYHATQGTTAARPILRQAGTGEYYLEFDGVDDFMITPTITPGIDKVQVFAGLRKLSDAAFGLVAETSTNINSNNGAISLYGNIGSGYSWQSKGTAIATANANSIGASPLTSVLASVGDISGDLAAIRVDGAQVATSSADQGTGNYLAYPMYIGSRAGSSLRFNGQLYSMLVRFGANLDANVITQTEKYVSTKTAGVELT